MANSVDSEQMLYYVVSDIGLHSLISHLCPSL